jgi:hypothetical protein
MGEVSVNGDLKKGVMLRYLLLLPLLQLTFRFQHLSARLLLNLISRLVFAGFAFYLGAFYSFGGSAGMLFNNFAFGFVGAPIPVYGVSFFHSDIADAK